LALVGYFPRSAAWDNRKKAVRGEYDETAWVHLAGTTSALFDANYAGEM
jgi:adenine-specific DNA-methyltransferase